MELFKPKNPRKTLIAILAEGDMSRAPRDRELLWQIRFEQVTGTAPASSATGRYESYTL